MSAVYDPCQFCSYRQVNGMGACENCLFEIHKKRVRIDVDMLIIEFIKVERNLAQITMMDDPPYNGAQMDEMIADRERLLKELGLTELWKEHCGDTY